MVYSCLKVTIWSQQDFIVVFVFILHIITITLTLQGWPRKELHHLSLMKNYLHTKIWGKLSGSISSPTLWIIAVITSVKLRVSAISERLHVSAHTQEWNCFLGEQRQRFLLTAYESVHSVLFVLDLERKCICKREWFSCVSFRSNFQGALTGKKVVSHVATKSVKANLHSKHVWYLFNRVRVITF